MLGMPPASEDRAQQLYLESLIDQITGWNNPRQRLAQAFSRNEFILYQQAIREIGPSSGPALVEILVRHQDEEKHLTPPGAFLPILEYHDMMPRLDQWVTTHAIRWYRENARQPLRLFINTAVRTMSEPRFAQFVKDQLAASGLAGDILCFEVQESELRAHGEAMLPVARALQSLGCAIAIGSVGRESVSFRALQAMAPNYVKLDGSLVRELHRDSVAHAKAQAINRVCQLAGIKTIAELVEQQITLDKLREIGVDYGQGFGISRPGPLADMEQK